MRGYEKGVTLVELLIVLVAFAILSAMAAPSFSAMIAKTRVTVAANELVHAITSARSLAVRNGRGSVTICPNDGPDECDTAGAWGNGFMLFEDDNGNSIREAGERIAQRWEAIKAPITLAANAWVVRFKSDGTISNDAGALFIVCDPTGKTAPRSVRVWGSGGHNLYSPQTCALP
jgi:type IV fimbrial biogenesis protein FimT